MEQNTDSNGPALYSEPLTLYHPTSRSSGSALSLEPRLNRRTGDRFNCFFLAMARQKEMEEKREFAAFDWDNKVTVKLDFTDICELLRVLEGHIPQAGRDGKGLFHQTAQANTIITLQRREQGEGFELGLSKKKNGEAPYQIRITLSEAEALGIRCIFQTGLFFITFHSQMNRRGGRPQSESPTEPSAP